ncbi:NPCBM/NEW2 domain-containing protein [Rubeoparvulum massiliense]|uniref:NPCBM/NEW2 domain-containing protein n=1 Tax=Rubeoparvulum massiliense TaxID=1631346 RepID=UPI0009781CBE
MGEYKKFISTIGLLDTSKNTVLTFNVAFILDGNSVYSTMVKAGDFPEEISFDTANAQKMTIRVTADSRNLFSTDIGLFNAHFIK